LFQLQLKYGRVAGVAADDDAFRVDDEGLAKPELLDRWGRGIDGRVVLAGVARVGLDVGKLP
jgi:hypothetical protein